MTITTKDIRCVTLWGRVPAWEVPSLGVRVFMERWGGRDSRYCLHVQLKADRAPIFAGDDCWDSIQAEDALDQDLNAVWGNGTQADAEAAARKLIREVAAVLQAQAEEAQEPVKVLVVACSDTKVQAEGLVKAVDLYDGPAYRILRKAQKAPEVVLVLSAGYGLIPADQLIQTYDTRMDQAIADEFVSNDKLVKAHQERIKEALCGRPVSSIRFHGGALYHSVIKAYEAMGMFPAPVEWDPRGIGHKHGTLKAWLNA